MIQIHGCFTNIQFNPVYAAAEGIVFRVVGIANCGSCVKPHIHCLVSCEHDSDCVLDSSLTSLFSINEEGGPYRLC